MLYIEQRATTHNEEVGVSKESSIEQPGSREQWQDDPLNGA